MTTKKEIKELNSLDKQEQIRKALNEVGIKSYILTFRETFRENENERTNLQVAFERIKAGDAIGIMVVSLMETLERLGRDEKMNLDMREILNKFSGEISQAVAQFNAHIGLLKEAGGKIPLVKEK